MRVLLLLSFMIRRYLMKYVLKISALALFLGLIGSAFGDGLYVTNGFWNWPECGSILSTITMGAFILYEIRQNRK